MYSHRFLCNYLLIKCFHRSSTSLVFFLVDFVSPWSRSLRFTSPTTGVLNSFYLRECLPRHRGTSCRWYPVIRLLLLLTIRVRGGRDPVTKGTDLGLWVSLSRLERSQVGSLYPVSSSGVVHDDGMSTSLVPWGPEYGSVKSKVSILG